MRTLGQNRKVLTKLYFGTVQLQRRNANYIRFLTCRVLTGTSQDQLFTRAPQYPSLHLENRHTMQQS